MESSVKTWMFRLLIPVPVLCLIISVVLWKHTQNETFAIETVNRKLNAFESEIKKMYNEVDNLHTQKRVIRSQIDSDKVQLQHRLQQIRKEVDNLHTQKRAMQIRIKRDKVQLNRQLKEVQDTNRDKRDASIGGGTMNFNLGHAAHADCHTKTTTGGGAMYVHWGREDCSSTADIVYIGIAGGGHYAHTGAAVNMLCLTRHPLWGNYGSNKGEFTFLYGTEYEVPANDFPLGHENARKLHNHDVPCTVCRSTIHTSVIMIPGTTVCETGWTKEYSGYLMAGRYGHKAATEYNCIDANPSAHESGRVDDDGYLLYTVKAKCGSLACPPYVDMREITCVVCTK